MSPDGKRCVTGGLNGTATVWDLATGAVQHPFEAQGAPVRSAGFSADSARVMTAAKNIELWDSATGGCLSKTELRLYLARAVARRAPCRIARANDTRRAEQLEGAPGRDQLVDCHDLDLRRGLLTVERSEWQGKVTQTKGLENRVVPMPAELTAKLVQMWTMSARRHVGVRFTG